MNIKLIVLSVTIGLVTISSFSQENNNIQDEFQTIFKIEKQRLGNKEYLIKRVNEIDTNSIFSDLVNNNVQYIDYLLSLTYEDSNYKKLMTIEDTTELQNMFIETLKKDSAFNKVMNKLTERYTNFSQFIPDTISMDEILNVAVKFFSIIKINHEGYYAGKVCGGINGLDKTEEIRNPQLEAFCFTTILNNYQGKQFSMYDEFVRGIKELYKINLGLKEEERLLRAQGAMYLFMRNNDKLKEVLLFEYTNKKQYLPFVLVENR